MVMALVTGGVLSLFASDQPDGLEWAIHQTSGKEDIISPEGIHKVFSDIQQKTSVLPDYDLKTKKEDSDINGTSLSGVMGGLMTLLIISALGFFLLYKSKHRKRRV